MSEDDFTIPDFCRIPDEVRKAAWERNPPKSRSSHHPSLEQVEAARLRAQSESDRKRMQRCVSKQRRLNREAALDAKLEGKKAIAEGKTWDVRTARWIDPIQEAMKPKDRKTKMPQSTKATKEEPASATFGFRDGTNYARMMIYLMDHVGQYVDVKALAEAAYGTKANVEKHCRRVITMARRTQEQVITKKRMAFEIKKEKDGNAIRIGIFRK